MQPLTWAVALAYLGQVLVTTALHVIILMGVGLLLGMLINFFSRAIQRHAADVLPFRLYTYLLFPGVILHELAHLFFLVIFGYHIRKVVLFQSKPNDPRLGYVEFDLPKGYAQVLGGFFSGVGPLVIGSLVLFGLSVLLLGPGVFEGISFAVAPVNVANLFETLGQLIQSIVAGTLLVFGRMIELRGVPGWQIALFFYLTFAIMNSMGLSPPDVWVARTGFFLLVGGLLLFNLATLWMGEDFVGSFFMELSRPLSSLYAMMLFALCLNVIVATFVVPFGIMFGRSAPR